MTLPPVVSRSSPSLRRQWQAPSASSGLERSAILDSFLGYVSTFFHDASRPRSKQDAPAMLSPRGRSSRQLPASFRPAGLRRSFHNYFVTHLPSSSLHPDSSRTAGPHHKLPRAASTPHTPRPGSSPAASPPNMPSRDLTVVRIPLRSAKHHFGAHNSRGSRPYNEDTSQAGTIDLPAFAKRAPISLVRSAMANSQRTGEGINADSPAGDPQIFYFAVFDGHGGSECSEFLKEELHGYIEETAQEFGMTSSLRSQSKGKEKEREKGASDDTSLDSCDAEKSLDQVEVHSARRVEWDMERQDGKDSHAAEGMPRSKSITGESPVPARADKTKVLRMERELLAEYKETVGGYFRRFKPAHFNIPDSLEAPSPITAESVLAYAFLRADLDFITAQARKPDPDDPYVSDFPLNKDEILGSPHQPPSGHGIGGPVRFKGGSTASVCLISTPTPAPFWHPAASSTMLVAHVGDTRVLLCETATGLARPLTRDHHPSSPTESRRLTRFAESLVTDSFGEERISGLANSRAFGDMQSKRIGVSAEPEITRAELGSAQYAFLVLMSDGVSGTLGDQEIVDTIKEARTPEQGAAAVVEYATEISADGDNATCLVVRLGGWERRSEGGLGSLGTKEIREARRAEAQDPRRRRS